MKRYISFFLLNILLVLLVPGAMSGAMRDDGFYYDKPIVLPSLPSDSHYQIHAPVFVMADISFNSEKFRSYVLDLAESSRKILEATYKSPIKMENSFYRAERPKVGKSIESAMTVYRLSRNNQVVFVDFFQQDAHISPGQFARDVLMRYSYFVERN